MSTGELERQRPLEDRERALLIGEEFGLGALEHVSRGRKFPKYTGWGLPLAPLVAIVAVPVRDLPRPRARVRGRAAGCAGHRLPRARHRCPDRLNAAKRPAARHWYKL
jgi:hypothetical protein